MNADVVLRTNQGFGASDVLLDLTPLTFGEEVAPTGGASLPRLLPARPAPPAPGEGHLHVTVTLSGEGRLRSRSGLAVHVGLTGTGHLVPPEVTAARRQRRDNEDLALIFDEFGLLP